MVRKTQSLNFGGYGPLGKDRLDEIERRRRAQGRGGPVIGAGATGNATSFLRNGGAQLRPGQALAFGQTGSDPGLVNLTSNIPSMIRSGTASPVGNAQEIMPRPAVTQQNRADYQSMLGQGAAPATDATGASPTARAASRLSEMEITKLSGLPPSQQSRRAKWVQQHNAEIAAEEAQATAKTEADAASQLAFDRKMQLQTAPVAAREEGLNARLETTLSARAQLAKDKLTAEREMLATRGEQSDSQIRLKQEGDTKALAMEYAAKGQLQESNVQWELYADQVRENMKFENDIAYAAGTGKMVNRVESPPAPIAPNATGRVALSPDGEQPEDLPQQATPQEQEAWDMVRGADPSGMNVDEAKAYAAWVAHFKNKVGLNVKSFKPKEENAQ